MQAMLLCSCSKEQFKFDGLTMSPESRASRDFSTSALSSMTGDGESVLSSAGGIEEAESSLREAMSLNNEEARALLGRYEYQQGNIESALHVFEGIDISSISLKIKQVLSEKPHRKKGRSRSASSRATTLSTVSVLLEAIFLKAKSLHALGQAKDAAHQCKLLLGTVESALPNGIPESIGSDSKLPEIMSNTLELLPELWKYAGDFHEAIISYRRALTSPWIPDVERQTRIQKDFAICLLYGGVDAPPPSLGLQTEDAYVPRNNIEEAILLLMIILRKHELKKLPWDPTIMEHLTFALSISGNYGSLAAVLEQILPGIYTRTDRWYSLALSYSAAGENEAALNLLKKILNASEKPDDVYAGLLAAKLCAESLECFDEGVQFANASVENCKDNFEHLTGVASGLLGICLGKKARSSAWDSEREKLQDDAIAAFEVALKREFKDPEVIFRMGIEYAEQRNFKTSREFAYKYLEVTAGCSLKGWKFLALILAAQKNFNDAETIIEAALDETGKWEQGDLLRLKAKVQMAQGKSIQAIETYKLLLALVQAQRKTSRTGSCKYKVGEDRGLEHEAWQDLSYLYIMLGRFEDGDVCLDKAKNFKEHSCTEWHAKGLSFESQCCYKESLSAFSNALAADPGHVPSMIGIASVLQQFGEQALPAARSFLTEALRLERNNHVAWCNLGTVYKKEGFIEKAMDCFQAAYVLQESSPPEKFSTAFGYVQR